MAYQGAEAYRLDNFERAYGQQQSHPAFDVIEGGGADARARRGVSQDLLSVVRFAAVAVIAFVLAGVVRVGITTQTVNVLSDNVALERQIAAFEAENSDMRIERSVLSSSARINRIAVQNFGMELATEHDLMTLVGSTADGGAADVSGASSSDATASGQADAASTTLGQAGL